MLYTITFDATVMDEYQRGLVAGIIYMATGAPEQTYAWARSHNNTKWYKTFECTEESIKVVVETIERVFVNDVIILDVDRVG